jgi:hypothetical protein
LIGVEPEIVKRAEANCIRVLIRRKRFRVPGNRGWVGGINIPRCAAISGVSYCAIMREARMLRRRVKPDVSDIDASSYRHGQKLNRPIEVLIIQSVFIVPHAATQVGYFVTHEPNSIGSVSRFDLIYKRTIYASPNHNGRLFLHGGAGLLKAEGSGSATHGIPTVRSIVIHVALVRMSLAPGAFVWDDVFRFCKIGRPLV